MPSTKSQRRRSRSRSRSRSRQAVNKVVDEVIEDPKERIIDDSLIDISLKQEIKSENPPGERKGRSRSKTTEKDLVDWAWDNVKGESEGRTRERRRSRSISRDRNTQENVGQVLKARLPILSQSVKNDIFKEQTETEIKEQTTIVAATPNGSVSTEKSVSPITLKECPWYSATLNNLQAQFIYSIQFLSFFIFYPEYK